MKRSAPSGKTRRRSAGRTLGNELVQLDSLGIPLPFLLERYGLSPDDVERVMAMKAIADAEAAAAAATLAQTAHDNAMDEAAAAAPASPDSGNLKDLTFPDGEKKAADD